MTATSSDTSRWVILSILGFCGVILAGAGMRYGLAALRKPPVQVEAGELSLRVDVVAVQPQDVQVVLEGHGTAVSRDTLGVMPQVAGKVVEVHPRLELGAVIPKGELLFKLDQTDYELAVSQAEAQVAQLETNLELLLNKQRIDTQRIEIFERNRELAQREFSRDKDLYESHDIGTETMVNVAELQFNQADDAYEQLSEMVALYPLKVKEVKTGLKAARAQLEQARLALSRTEVYAPFTGRVKKVQVEVGQLAAPGALAVALADDSVLEISVPLDSRDASQWLAMARNGAPDETVWFGDLEPVTCRITWTEDEQGRAWEGTLDRVERYDPMSRTVNVAVRVTGEQARAQHGLALIEGMFCHIEIPGVTLEQVYRVPRWAVSFEDDVYLCVDGRLERRPVEVARTQGAEALIAGGLAPGDLVVATRLVNPLPGSLLDHEVQDLEAVLGSLS